jgi:hypothetical protein
MNISKELLLQEGFEERVIESQTVFVKGHVALVYVFNVWVPCYYSYGAILADRLYINTMEELAVINS